MMAKKRQPKHLPRYDHARTSFAGIRERLALASLAFSKTWAVPASMSTRLDCYGHSVRFLGKKEGWESSFTWYDDDPNINITNHRRDIAHGIEAARATYYDNRQPLTGELLAIVNRLHEKKAA